MPDNCRINLWNALLVLWRYAVAWTLRRLARKFSQWEVGLTTQNWSAALERLQPGWGYWCTDCHYAVMKHADGQYYWYHKNLDGTKWETEGAPYAGVWSAAGFVDEWERLGCSMRPYQNPSGGTPCA